MVSCGVMNRRHLTHLILFQLHANFHFRETLNVLIKENWYMYKTLYYWKRIRDTLSFVISASIVQRLLRTLGVWASVHVLLYEMLFFSAWLYKVIIWVIITCLSDYSPLISQQEVFFFFFTWIFTLFFRSSRDCHISNKTDSKIHTTMIIHTLWHP